MTPTGAQFQTIFKFLIGNVDPNYEFRGKKFEDEVGPALKMAQYPFADSITKSHLQAVGSQQSWPNMLAMLHWLVVMVEVRLLAGFASEAGTKADPPTRVRRTAKKRSTTARSSTFPRPWTRSLRTRTSCRTPGSISSASATPSSSRRTTLTPTRRPRWSCSTSESVRSP